MDDMDKILDRVREKLSALSAEEFHAKLESFADHPLVKLSEQLFQDREIYTVRQEIFDISTQKSSLHSKKTSHQMKFKKSEKITGFDFVPVNQSTLLLAA